ncbi:crotonase/enoyl-CoA hydratase family protein [Streptomyces sp. NPDC002845]
MSRVLTDFSDGVAVVTINRPEVRNAIDSEVAGLLARAMDEVDARADIVVGVLTGAGGTFCAGMDLKAYLRGERPSIEERGFAGITERPPSKPLIAAVEGWALVGGCELALAADLIVAAPGVRFGLPEVKRGLAATAGGLLRLPKALPYQLAMEAALTGDPLTAEAAHALMGARELAARIAANGPLAVRASKQVVSMSRGYLDAEAYARQRQITAPVLDSADAREGARAFTEKRAPVWRGE